MHQATIQSLAFVFRKRRSSWKLVWRGSLPKSKISRIRLLPSLPSWRQNMKHSTGKQCYPSGACFKGYCNWLCVCVCVCVHRCFMLENYAFLGQLNSFKKVGYGNLYIVCIKASWTHANSWGIAILYVVCVCVCGVCVCVCVCVCVQAIHAGQLCLVVRPAELTETAAAWRQDARSPKLCSFSHTVVTGPWPPPWGKSTLLMVLVMIMMITHGKYCLVLQVDDYEDNRWKILFGVAGRWLWG